MNEADRQTNMIKLQGFLTFNYDSLKVIRGNLFQGVQQNFAFPFFDMQ